MLSGVRNVAIVGAAGRMGRWLCRLLVSEGFNVLANDVDMKGLMRLKEVIPDIRLCSLEECVSSSEVMIISVPINTFEHVVKELANHVQRDYVVLDVCSIKEMPVRIMHKYLRCLTLGTHPLFGPGAKSLSNRVVIMTPKSSEELELSLEIIDWLKSRNAYGVVMDPVEHDRLMRLLMGVPHMIAIILSKFLSRYDLSTFRLLKTPTFNFMMSYVAAVIAGNLEISVNIHRYLNTLDDLKELMSVAYELAEDIINKPHEVINELLTISNKFVKEGIDVNESYKVMYSILNET